jgi:predicted TIM-barrel fold metal-dependent hydrolase
VPEIRKRAGDRRFAHVLFLSRTSELLGKRRYWPIFEAAVEAGCPSACTSSARAAAR